MRFRPLARVCLVVAALSVLATACNSGKAATSAAANGLEKTDLTIGMLPLPEVAPVQIAIKRGFFKAEGLNVKFTIIDGGGSALPSLLSGGFDVLHSNYVSAFTAASQKVADLKVVAEATVATPGSFVLVTAPNSNVTKVEDLKGKTIGVNTKRNVAMLTTSVTLKVHGLDLDRDKIEFAEIPFPNMWQALKTGQVAAAFLPEPFVSAAAADGGVKVTDLMAGPTDSFPIAGYFVTADFASKNPKTVAAFQRALLKAQSVAASDRKAVAEVLPLYTKINAQTAEIMQLPGYPITTNAVRLQRVSDLMSEYGYLQKPFNVNSLLLAGQK
ncbi:ABC transporter substrate-binding protein [Streptosporangium carneum]|uniref:Sulfonate ABC transporter substrate-binding protein n=1 Tax=Streptosporangium carneum TaxID=47481 RepID=A0A9W6MBQ8_9ACTN|nr:ABC transporter substrate-binding protein [Streptosporangium carneum]GLK07933.1 sulfonate ABC transporter substrate-binding protein [Streptosporangium carneum]